LDAVNLAARLAILSQSTLFGPLPPDMLERLATAGDVHTYRTGEQVFSKGDPGNHLFVIGKGRIKIASRAPDGRETVLNLLGPGAAFGEVAVIEGGLRTADAEAAEPAQLLLLRRAPMLTALATDTAALLRLMAALAERVRWVSDSFEDALFLPLPARLAKRLIFLSRHFGLDTARGRRLTASLPQRELASHLNVTRESINRLLHDWRQAGLVDEDRGVLILIDLARLERIAEGTERPPQKPLDQKL
jgi:CRP/FNR family cyclic AMP-dependent transcriptional regulator